MQLEDLAWVSNICQLPFSSRESWGVGCKTLRFYIAMTLMTPAKKFWRMEVCINEDQGGSGWMLDVPRRWEKFKSVWKNLVDVCVCVCVCVCVSSWMHVCFLSTKCVVCYYLNICVCVLHMETHTEVSSITFDNRKCKHLFPFLFSFLFLTFVMES